MTTFLTALVSRLPVRAQPYAKALVPIALAAFLALQDLAFSVEEIDELKVLAGGAVTSLLVLALPSPGYQAPTDQPTPGNPSA